MAILKVARMGHPVLRARARPIDPASISSVPVQKLIDDMLETMAEYQGIGLAAPQVHESLRVFVAGSESDGEFPLMAVINPEITPLGTTTADDWEGCLSIPDIRGQVPRALEVRLRGLDRHGRRLEMVASAFPARVLQHEHDHLEGILFLDRMRSFDTLTFLDEYGRYWREEQEVEK